jgi:hypothetical protein
MPAAIRRLGIFLFCVGCVAVVVGVIPLVAESGDEKHHQVWLAICLMGGLVSVSGLVMDWLGSQAIRDQQNVRIKSPVVRNDTKPPAMRLSSRPAGNKGYREDLMA